MKFVKKLVIYFISDWILGLFLILIPFINPYFLLSVIFKILVALFYMLLSVDLGFTILYIYLLFTKSEPNPIKCYDIDNYGITCKLCDYYIGCKLKKESEL